MRFLGRELSEIGSTRKLTESKQKIHIVNVPYLQYIYTMYRLLWYRPPVSGERKHSREGLLPCAGSIDISRLSLLLVRLSVWRLFIVVLFFLIVHFGLYSLVFASLNVSCLHSCLIFFLLVLGFLSIFCRGFLYKEVMFGDVYVLIYTYFWGFCGVLVGPIS